MNDEIKEILIDLVNYYNRMGTESDPGILVFENVAQRASRTLENYAKRQNVVNKKSADVDPFGDVESSPNYKLEDEW